MDEMMEQKGGGAGDVIGAAVQMLTALTPALKDLGAPAEVQSAADVLLKFLSGGGEQQTGPAAEQSGGNPNARPMA